jgi:hypothetical protein
LHQIEAENSVEAVFDGELRDGEFNGLVEDERNQIPSEFCFGPKRTWHSVAHPATSTPVVAKPILDHPSLEAASAKEDVVENLRCDDEMPKSPLTAFGATHLIGTSEHFVDPVGCFAPSDYMFTNSSDAFA